MPTLAPKLPWQHAFAGGYPGRSGQYLPVDADAIDYLNRVAAADGGVSVEVGIAQAIDAFVRGCKADGTWSAIQASCIMCGARTLSGALVPLKGAAPTPYNFTSSDYSRSGATPGLKGNGTTKYLDTNRAGNADGQNDHHAAVYVSTQSSVGSVYMSNRDTVTSSGYVDVSRGTTDTFFRSASDSAVSVSGLHTGLIGISRSDSAGLDVIASNSVQTLTLASQSQSALSVLVFDRKNTAAKADARIAFYSVGSSLSLSALNARVSTLVSQIAAAIP